MATDDDDKTQVYLPGTGGQAPAVPSPLSGGGTPNAKLICQDVSFLDDGSPSLEIALSGSEITVGREAGNAVTIRSKQLSRKHARLYPGDGKWGVADMGSKNGTWVNESSIKETWLSPGDVVKIGPIPFKYELERPEVGSSAPPPGQTYSETVVDKTMLVGSDVRAASALLRAAEKRTDEQTGPRAEAAHPVRAGAEPARAVRPQAAAAAPAAAKNGWIKGALIALVVLAMLGGGGFFGWRYMQQAEMRDLVKVYNRDLKTFMADNEAEVGDFSKVKNQQQLDELRGLLTSVNDTVQKYPDSPDLRGQQVRLLFLTFERQLSALLNAGAARKALELHTSTTDALARIRTAVASDHQAFKATVKEVSGLFRLAKSVIQLRGFSAQYPEPSAQAASKPTQAEIDEMRDWRTQFAAEKRSNNLALSVRYRYFAKTVKEVDKKDLRVLDRWQQII